MARQKASIPTYRKCTIHGNTRAMVTLTDAATGQRRAFYLGEYGTPESREKYLRLLADWEARGRRIPGVEARRPRPLTNGPTVTQLCHAFWTAIDGRYTPSHRGNFKLCIRLLRERMLAILHRNTNHEVRDVCATIIQSVSRTEEPVPQRRIAIHALAKQFLRNICDVVADEIGRQTCEECSTCIGTVVDSVTVRATLARKGLSPMDLWERAKNAGGTGKEFEDGEKSHPMVHTTARSHKQSGERVKSSSCGWFISASPAHAHFHERSANANQGVYCPPYDLELTKERRNKLIRKDSTRVLFTCPRKEWWQYYRSVATFPIRTQSFQNATGLIGFLWIDSPKPNAFRRHFEQDAGRQRLDWSATMNFIHAITDATAIVLGAKLLADQQLNLQLRRPSRGEVVTKPQVPQLELGALPKTTAGQATKEAAPPIKTQEPGQS